MKKPLFIFLIPIVIHGVAIASIPEPDILFYGRIYQHLTPMNADVSTPPQPVTTGTLVWTIQPPTGSAFNLETQLQPLSDGFVYRLAIPVTAAAPETTENGSINASSNMVSYGRATVTLNGQPLYVVTPSGPQALAFTFSQANRGKIERIDLFLGNGIGDSDRDGIPDYLEASFDVDGIAGRNSVGDVDGDLDGDGIRDLDEYINGSHLYGFDYQQWLTMHDLTGNNALPFADPDKDSKSNLLEFSVGCDPNVSDLAAFNQHVSHEVVDGDFCFFVNKPYPQQPLRTDIEYYVEQSTNLADFYDATALTVIHDDNQIEVRFEDAISRGPNFFRFAVEFR
jgi:hypothetical protein